MAELVVELARISPTQHRFSYRRPDGTGEALELETKSFLFHDLLHFAVETEVGLQHSFYGNLARSSSYSLLAELNGEAEGEIGMTERIVGGLTGFLKQESDRGAFLLLMQNMLDATGEQLPFWLTETSLTNIKERMRRLQGEWNALPFGASIKLDFPVIDCKNS
ncbi:MAG: hypothetical protein ABIO72_01410 [Patescibacteria group bacterium]